MMRFARRGKRYGWRGAWRAAELGQSLGGFYLITLLHYFCLLPFYFLLVQPLATTDLNGATYIRYRMERPQLFNVISFEVLL
jgi:hypothetical protein